MFLKLGRALVLAAIIVLAAQAADAYVSTCCSQDGKNVKCTSGAGYTQTIKPRCNGVSSVDDPYCIRTECPCTPYDETGAYESVGWRQRESCDRLKGLLCAPTPDGTDVGCIYATTTTNPGCCVQDGKKVYCTTRLGNRETVNPMCLGNSIYDPFCQSNACPCYPYSTPGQGPSVGWNLRQACGADAECDWVSGTQGDLYCRPKTGSTSTTQSTATTRTTTTRTTATTRTTTTKTTKTTRPTTTTLTPTCVDSDGGNNKDVAGTVTRTKSNGKTISNSDKCSGKTKLKEYFCKSDTAIGTQIYRCRCDGGACVTATTTTTTSATLTTTTATVTTTTMQLSCQQACGQSYPNYVTSFCNSDITTCSSKGRVHESAGDYYCNYVELPGHLYCCCLLPS